MKLIRWWGIGVFAGLIVLVTLAWYFLAPLIIADTIEEFGSEALGAKVEVGSVELSLFPVAVTLNQLRAADPDQPMQNMFESSAVKFSVDSGSLLWKKLVIDELRMQDVQTGTQRDTSGALVGGRKSTQAISRAVEIAIPDVNDIDVDALVEKADLITLNRIETLKNSQQNIEQQWQQALDKEAFDARTAAIEKEFNRLSARAKDNKLNLIKDRKEWKKLKKTIDQERQSISTLSDKIKSDKALLSQQFKAVKNGPKDDLQAVMGNLGLDNGVDGLVDKYLGPQYTPWVKRALAMVSELKPAGETSGESVSQGSVQVGQKIYFKDEHQVPEILIKKLVLSGGETDWRMDGKGFDLGYLPWLTGKPAKLDVKMKGERQASIDLASHWPSASQMSTQLTATVKQWPLKAMSLMETAQGNWLIESGNFVADIQGELTLDSINLNASFSLVAPKLSVPDEIAGWQKNLANSISQQSQIDFQLKATGSIASPKINLSSSLENLFQQAIGDRVKQEAQKLTGKVEASIRDKVGDLSALENFDDQFSQWQSQLGNKDEMLKSLLAKIKI